MRAMEHTLKGGVSSVSSGSDVTKKERKKRTVPPAVRVSDAPGRAAHYFHGLPF